MLFWATTHFIDCRILPQLFASIINKQTTSRWLEPIFLHPAFSLKYGTFTEQFTKKDCRINPKNYHVTLIEVVETSLYIYFGNFSTHFSQS